MVRYDSDEQSIDIGDNSDCSSEQQRPFNHVMSTRITREYRQVSRSVGLLNNSERGPAQRRRDERQDRAYGADGGEDAAPGGEPAPPPERPIMSSPELLHYVSELGEGRGKAHCFACEMLQDFDHAPPVCQTGLESISRMVQNSSGHDKVQVARSIKRLYDRQIREKVNSRRRETDPECKEWHAADIYEHFFTQKHGRIDAVASLEQRILFFERALQDMRDKYVYTSMPGPDGQPVHVPDPRRLSEAMKVSQELTRMYMIQPSKMPLAAQSLLAPRASDMFTSRPVYRSLPQSYNH